MKKFTLVIALLSLVSCGKRTVTKTVEVPKENKELNEKVINLQNKISVLEKTLDQANSATNDAQEQLATLLDEEAKVKELTAQLTFITNQLEQAKETDGQLIAFLESKLALLEAELEALEESASTREQQIATLEKSLNDSQALANNLQEQLASIKAGEDVVEIIDPCGDNKGQDDVVLKFKSGKYASFFKEHGKRTFEFLEKNVVYRTTDGKKCLFMIDDLGNIIID